MPIANSALSGSSSSFFCMSSINVVKAPLFLTEVSASTFARLLRSLIWSFIWSAIRLKVLVSVPISSSPL